MRALIDNGSCLKDEIQSHGWEPGEIHYDGEIHRFDIDKRNDKAGWYVGYRDGDFLSGAFGSWKEGGKHRWCNRGGAERSEKEQAIHQKRMAEAEQKRVEAQEKAKRRAKAVWGKATTANDEHPYLLKKKVKAHGLKQHKGKLLVPVVDKGGKGISIQFIDKNGKKRFLPGGAVAGGSFTIRGNNRKILCEGYATGASIHEATGATVKIAFNAGNLEEVAKPGWIIAGDNDQFTRNQRGEPWNPGREKALTAAWKHNCPVAIPEFSNTEDKSTDFNDLAKMEGVEAIRKQIDGAVYPAEYLLKECDSDVGAAYRREHIEGLRLYRERNQAGFMALREKLKRLHVGVTELDKAIKGNRMDSGGENVTHLTLAREVAKDYGEGNLIYAQNFPWRWKLSGVWRKEEDRGIKKRIQIKVGQAIEDPKKSDVESILDMTKTEIFRPEHRFDLDQSTINCKNGEITWTGHEWRLEKHCRENYRTTQVPVAYDPKAQATRFAMFLDEIYRDDPDGDGKQILTCELIGYTLLSTTRYEKFILLIGRGANGKSVLMGVVKELLGTPNVCAVQPSQFENRFQRAHLHNKLANLVTELAVGAEIHDAQLKAIVSGELTTAEHKHKPPFDFEPYSTCWFGTNHMPHTRDFSDALFRRAVILPFNRVFQEREQDKNLLDKFKAELPGILNLALKGMADVFGRGCFTETESGLEAKKKWRLNADQAAEFAEDKCQFGSGLSIESGKLYEAYKNWSEDVGIKRTLNRNNFTQRISRLGAEPGKGTSGLRVIFGVDLKGNWG